MTATGERISIRRRELGLNQQQLAEKLNVTQMQVSKYERGVNYPSTETLILLVRVLDTSADYLLGLSSNPTGHYDGAGDITGLQRELLEITDAGGEDFQRKLLQIAKIMRD